MKKKTQRIVTNMIHYLLWKLKCVNQITDIVLRVYN